MLIRTILFVVSLIVPVLLEKKSPTDIVNRLVPIAPEIEAYVNSQLQLDHFAEEYKIQGLPEDQKNATVLQLTSKPEVQSIIAECGKFHQQPACDGSVYRRVDGTCNNLRHSEWGSALSEQRRMWPAVYHGQYEFRKSVTGEELPNARVISINMETEKSIQAEVSAMFTFFGQFVTHDMVVSPVTTRNSTPIDCCGEPNQMQCHVVQVPAEDTFFPSMNVSCLNFIRSAAYPKCNFEKRSPLNAKTSYVDLSNVYGNSDELCSSLRRNDGSGRLRTQYSTMLAELMPSTNASRQGFCIKTRPDLCLDGGDDRINSHTTLAMLQNAFALWHNRIASNLHWLHSEYQEETLFQEARRISIALYQKIVYTEYLPLLIGKQIMTSYDLWLDFKKGSQYDDTVDATMDVEFSTAAFRLHSMVPHSINGMQSVSMTSSYCDTRPLFGGRTTSWLAGTAEVPSQKNDPYFLTDITNFLYRPPGADYGFDLATINIQRGRDHGLPSYVDVLKSWRNMDVRKFSDLKQLVAADSVTLLEKIYKDVRDIDLWIGMIAEKPVYDGVVGPTAADILAKVFHKVKFGDNFFVTHRNGRHPFTYDQLKFIESFSLAKFMCESLNLVKVRRYPLNMPSERNPLIYCISLPTMDWTIWT